MPNNKFYFNKVKNIGITFLGDIVKDRCNTIFKNDSVKLITPIGKLANHDFETICHETAQNFSKHDKIFLYWSGGLDSTAVFLLLREYVKKEQLTILYTKNSLIEYPHFFENNIANKFNSVCFDVDKMSQTTECFCKLGIIITGEISDQLFGSVLFNHSTSDTLKTKWDSFKNGIFLSIPNINEFVDKCPQKIDNLAELLWWFNYSLKYQCVQTRMLLDNKSSKLNENIFHFFDNEKFNDYAVSTSINLKMPNIDVKNYKYPLRKVIYNLSKDENYAFNKPKVASWIQSDLKNVATAIDLNWTRYYENI